MRLEVGDECVRQQWSINSPGRDKFTGLLPEPRLGPKKGQQMGFGDDWR